VYLLVRDSQLHNSNWGYNSRSGVLSHCVSWNCGLLGHCMEFSAASCRGVSGKKGGPQTCLNIVAHITGWFILRQRISFHNQQLCLCWCCSIFWQLTIAILLEDWFFGPSCWQTVHLGLGQELTWALVSQIRNSKLSSCIMIFRYSSIPSWLLPTQLPVRETQRNGSSLID